jgi:16S rRNA (cytosine967-C5)-methyltransferase
MPGPRCNPGRSAAYSRLATEASKYPDLGLDTLDTGRAPERDAALGHAIYDSAVRRWLTISYLAGLHLRQQWDQLEAGVLGGLLGGGAQLLFFDRVPPHSAIDETVEWTKHAVNPQAGGLVNAVLRKIAGMIVRDSDGQPVRRESWTAARDELPLADGRTVVLHAPVLPPDGARRVAAATGVPVWQVRQWAERFGQDEATRLARHAIATAPTIMRTANSTFDEPTLTTHESAAHRVFVGSRSELVALLGRHPALWVQDPSASAAVTALGAQPAKLVVDLCAGRGTKTRQLLAKYPDAQVVACEVIDPRLADLRALAETADGRLRVCRPEQAVEELRGRADLVVADVPCSNSGVLARRTEARHRCGPRQVTRLADQQREIVALGASLLVPGGRMLYSTCSLETEENAAIATWAGRALGLAKSSEHQRLPGGGPGLPPGAYQDGGYTAVLRSPGTLDGSDDPGIH